MNTLPLAVLPLAVFWPLPTEQDPTAQTPTLHKIYTLYIICPLLCSMEQKYILFMHLNRVFNKEILTFVTSTQETSTCTNANIGS